MPSDKDKFKQLPGCGGFVIIGRVERPEFFEGHGELRDKTGQCRFEITADVLEQFIGQRVEVTIKPLK